LSFHNNLYNVPEDLSFGVGGKISYVEFLTRDGVRGHLPNQGWKDTGLVVVIGDIREGKRTVDFHRAVLIKWLVGLPSLILKEVALAKRFDNEGLLVLNSKKCTGN